MGIDNLEQFTGRFTSFLKRNPGLEQILDEGRQMLAELTSNQEWLRPVLSQLVLDDAFLHSQWQSIDPYDIQLYHSPEKLFSVRAFIWEPDETYPVHDHGAWGLVGACINRVEERKFARVDDGSDVNRAEVKQVSEAQLAPGQTTFVLPVNDGIHQMAALDDRTAVTVHVYGRPVRKGYINYFNRHNNTVQRMYPPSINKRIYAIRSLGTIAEPWAGDVLQQARRGSSPEYIQTEIEFSLNKIKTLS
ncbi:MAG: cysteine dioxygenase family protein [Syntrophomonadaceae bacterium]